MDSFGIMRGEEMLKKLRLKAKKKGQLLIPNWLALVLCPLDWLNYELYC